MSKTDLLGETPAYEEVITHKVWFGKAIRKGPMPSHEASDLVAELLITYAEAIPDVESKAGDIYATAYELASTALKDMKIDLVYTIYRDYLLDAMFETASDHLTAQCRPLVRFANLVSSAYCTANSDMLRRTIRRDRVELFSSELKTAKSIQRHLLPKTIPSIPGFEFAGKLIPAAEVGGDYWSIKHYQSDDIVTMKLADISGHGVAAATLVAAVKFVSGCYYRSSATAAEVMEQTNRVLTIETPSSVLVTMVYAWLRPNTCELTVVNAGHEPAFLCHDGTCTDIRPTGPVLGVTEIAEYKETNFSLHRGDIIFFGSDGITEAGIGERFGVERLKRLIADNAHASASDIVDTVINAVRDFDPNPHDDISLLVAKAA